MSSSSHTTINGYPVLSNTNAVFTIGFRASDQRILERKVSERNPLLWCIDETNDLDELETCYEYHATAKVVRRRLELDGYGLEAVEREFRDTTAEWLEWVRSFHDKTSLDFSWCFSVLETPVLADWLEALRRLIVASRRPPYPLDHVDLSGESAIERMLLQKLTFESFYVGDLHFPVQSIECFLRAVLEVVPDDALCIVDASDVVRAGYTDEFDARAHLGNTHSAYLDVFRESATEILELAMLSPNNHVLTRLLFANVITAVETYLADTAKWHITKRPALLRRFVETHDTFIDAKKIAPADIFRRMDGIHNEVCERLAGLVFHNLATVAKIYENVFLVDLPAAERAELGSAVAVRHDIVHRNGRDKVGVTHPLAHEHVVALVETATRFATSIDEQLREGCLHEIDADADE